MKNDYDADDELPEHGEADGLRWMTVGVVLLVVVGFFALAWYAYQSTSQPSSEALETIRADAGPIKEKPKDPGGMNIPYQDMSVYNVISDGEKKDEGKTEQLLPDPEEPIASRTTEVPKEEDRSVFIKDEPIDTPKTETLSAKPAEQVKTDKPAVTTSETAVVKDAPVTGIGKPIEALKPVEAPKAEAPASTAEPKRFMEKPVDAKAAPAEGGSVVVQLAALKSTEEAEKTWSQVLSRFPTPLTGKQHNVVKAELPSGTFYRLRVGGFTAEAAKKLCTDLAAKKQPCMIVR